MTQLVLATGNRGKVREFRSILASPQLTLLSSTELNFTDFPAEQGNSYEDNAMLKACYAAKHLGLPCLADDSGLEVDALHGGPGIYSARYGGNLSNGERIAYLLQKIRSVPKEHRGASFVCALVVATPKGDVKSFRGSCQGEILQGPRGDHGFGYDPIFYSHDLAKTFGQADAKEKHRVSHRGKALEEFKHWLNTPEARVKLYVPLAKRR